MLNIESTFINFLSPLLITNRRTLLVAFSGGIDSVVLGHLCARFFKGCFALAYFNHQLRGLKEQEKEKQVVKQIAKDWGVKLFYQEVNFDLREKALQQRKSLEELAREVRYGFLFSVKNAYDFAYLATAHHQDDQLETFLMRLSQRSSWSSLRGIRSCEKRGLIRPLLAVSRCEIEDYATRNNLKYAYDSSNESKVFLRNRFRHILLPAWQEVLPHSKASLLDWQKRLSELYHWTSQYLPSWQKASKSVYLPLQDWLNLPSFLKKELVVRGIRELQQLCAWSVYPKITAKFLDTLDRKQKIYHGSILLKGYSLVLVVNKELLFLKPLLVQSKKISYLLKVNLGEEITWLGGVFYLNGRAVENLLLVSYDRRWDFWRGTREQGRKFFSYYVRNLSQEVVLLVYQQHLIALWHKSNMCFLWKKEGLEEELKFLLQEEGAHFGSQ